MRPDGWRAEPPDAGLLEPREYRLMVRETAERLVN